MVRQQKTMVAQMVVCVANAHVEHHPAPYFSKIDRRSGSVTDDEVRQFEITGTGSRIRSVNMAGERHRGCEMQPLSVPPAIKPFGQERVMV